MKNYRIISILLIIVFMIMSMGIFVFAEDGGYLVADVGTKKSGLQEYHEKISSGEVKGKGKENEKLKEYKDKGLITDVQYDKIKQANFSNLSDKQKENFLKAFDAFMEEWREILAYASAFGTLSAFIIFIIIFLRLSYLPSHPIQRRQAMIDIITSGVSTALLGGLTLMLSIFYDSFRGIIENGIMLSSDWRVSFTILLYEYRTFIIGFLGLATLTLILMFIKSFIGLAVSAGSPAKRSQALTGVLLTGIASMGIGGLTFWVYFFIDALK